MTLDRPPESQTQLRADRTYDEHAVAIAQAWSDVLELSTALEIARAAMTPLALEREGHSMRVVTLVVDALVTRRNHHGLGLSDSLIVALASRAQDVFDKRTLARETVPPPTRAPGERPAR